MSACVFCRIRDGELPSSKVYEDDQVLAFRDINPQAPVHIPVVPRKHIASLAEVEEADRDLLGHVQLVIRRVAEQAGLAPDGYRVVVNTGRRPQGSVPWGQGPVQGWNAGRTLQLVETRGFEPPTPWLQTRCSPAELRPLLLA